MTIGAVTVETEVWGPVGLEVSDEDRGVTVVERNDDMELKVEPALLVVVAVTEVVTMMVENWSQ